MNSDHTYVYIRLYGVLKEVLADLMRADINTSYIRIYV